MTSFSWLIGKKCIINELFSTLNSFWMACPFELVNPSLKSYDCIHFQNQKIFSLFSLNFADVSIYYRHFSCHFRWRQVSWRDVIMVDFSQNHQNMFTLLKSWSCANFESIRSFFRKIQPSTCQNKLKYEKNVKIDVKP